MNRTLTAMALALALPAFAAPAAASATQEQAAERKLEVSKKAQKPLLAIQTALAAGDFSTMPTLVANAEAAIQKPDDRKLLGDFIRSWGVKTDDYDVALRGVRMADQSGLASDEELVSLYTAIGRTFYQNDRFADGIALFERAVEIQPDNGEIYRLIAESEGRQGRTEQAIAAYQRAFEVETLAGRTVSEEWYGRALGYAAESDSADLYPLSRSLLTAYPSTENWFNVLAYYQNRGGYSDDVYLDLYRLRNTVGVLRRPADYSDYASLLVFEKNAGEAQAVVDAGIAAGMLDTAGSVRHKEIVDAARQLTARSDRATLDADAKAAASKSTGSVAENYADLYYGYGDYDKSAEMYRVALGLGGIETPKVQFRYGMALARAGQYDQARTELAKVDGEYADLAKYWMTYIDTRS